MHEAGCHGLQLKEVAQIHTKAREKGGGDPACVHGGSKGGYKRHFKPLQTYFPPAWILDGLLKKAPGEGLVFTYLFMLGGLVQRLPLLQHVLFRLQLRF